jgi:hypothetical protein
VTPKTKQNFQIKEKLNPGMVVHALIPALGGISKGVGGQPGLQNK